MMKDHIPSVKVRGREREGKRNPRSASTRPEGRQNNSPTIYRSIKWNPFKCVIASAASSGLW